MAEAKFASDAGWAAEALKAQGGDAGGKPALAAALLGTLIAALKRAAP